MPRFKIERTGDEKRIALWILACVWLTGCARPTLPIKTIGQDCVAFQKDMSSATLLAGTLILNQGETVRFSGSDIVSGTLPHEKSNEKAEVLSNISVSPDRLKIAFLSTFYTTDTNEYLGRDLVLVRDDKVFKEVSNWGGLGDLIGWFDNDWLLVSPTNLAPGTVILFNPVTDQTKQINPAFPAIFDLPPMPFWYKSSNPLSLYDSTLSLAFYLQDANGMTYSLWDIGLGKIVWTKSVSNPRVSPMWSPNGEQIVFAAPKDSPIQFELYRVDRQGKEEQLTALGSEYKTVYITDLSWSPDGTQIALAVDYQKGKGDETNPRLAVLDLSQGKITDYCIGPSGTQPIWSPDGQSVAVEVENKQDSRQHTVVINLKNQSAVSVSDKGYPVGWIP